MFSQDIESVNGPTQSMPPFCGAGLVQVRSRVRKPGPQKASHSEKGVHSVKLPSIISNRRNEIHVHLFRYPPLSLRIRFVIAASLTQIAESSREARRTHTREHVDAIDARGVVVTRFDCALVDICRNNCTGLYECLQNLEFVFVSNSHEQE